MTNDHEQALRKALGEPCTITIEPAANGVTVRASYTEEEVRKNGPTAMQLLTQVGMQAIYKALNNYEEKATKQQPPLH